MRDHSGRSAPGDFRGPGSTHRPSCWVAVCLLHRHASESDEPADMSLTIPLPSRDASPSSSEPQTPGSIIIPDVRTARPLPPRLQLTRPRPCSRSLRMRRRAATRQLSRDSFLQLLALILRRSTKSLNQSIFDYVRENGRTYHRYKLGCKSPSLAVHQGECD